MEDHRVLSRVVRGRKTIEEFLLALRRGTGQVEVRRVGPELSWAGRIWPVLAAEKERGSWQGLGRRGRRWPAREKGEGFYFENVFSLILKLVHKSFSN
jgi:hypothetical protein